MSITIRPAGEQDIPAILTMVNRFAAQNVMLPRTEASVQQTLSDWLVATDAGDVVAGCGSLVPLTDTLVEIRSLATHEDYQGQGIGGLLVQALIDMAREQEYEQVCALTLRTSFFERLGFTVVDRWSISPKVWQACIYCPKFHRCDEVAVLMPLVEKPAKLETKPPAWNGLLRWDSWQPLKLAYQQRPDHHEE
ncbi:MAG: GNAT family N-acetyltransferase [Caldilineaceae bacterium]|nr:GNAT family N-acetyltransferase [Caldilineaceae bacterium]